MGEFKPRKSAGDLVAEAESRIKSVSPDEISGEVASGKALVIDVREPEDEQGAETVVTTPYDVGDVVGDFTLPTLAGGEGRLSDYRGKVILLVFTATWCPYCGVEAPFLEQEIWQRFQRRGVQVVAIDVKEPPEVMRPFRDRYGWTFPVWRMARTVVAFFDVPWKVEPWHE